MINGSIDIISIKLILITAAKTASPSLKMCALQKEKDAFSISAGINTPFVF